MLLAHLSDLHLRNEDDAVWLDRQLDRIVLRAPDHLAITGDILDRWAPALLDRVLDALGRRGMLHRDRLTLLHGNHDLASGGGHPRGGSDLWRLVFRFWDPPPLLAWHRRRFYEQVERRAPGVAAQAPFAKTTPSGVCLAVLDTIPLAWRPVRIRGGILAVQHALGCIRQREAAWLAAVSRRPNPLIVLMHHYPLDTPAFQWRPERGSYLPARGVQVPMHIVDPGRAEFWRAAAAAGVRLVLCGHVHRARLERHQGIAVGLNGQSGAAWAGRTIAYYDIDDRDVRVEYEGV